MPISGVSAGCSHVVVNEGDRLSGVVNESGLGVLVPGNVINTIGSIVVPARENLVIAARRGRIEEKGRRGGKDEKKGSMTKWHITKCRFMAVVGTC